MTYDLYISKTEDFQNPIIHREIEDTTFQLPDTLEQGQSYYWKVQAVNWEYDSLWCSNANGFFVSHDAVTDIDDDDQVASDYQLEQNYPNPFNPTTTIAYTIPKQSFVDLIVYDLKGNIIQTLINENKPAGRYAVNFYAKELSSGIYFYRLYVGSRLIDCKKMMVLK